MAIRKKYSEQYRRDAVRLMQNRGSRTVLEIAESVGVSQSMLHRWHQQYGGEEGRRSAVDEQDDQEDVEKLRRRLRELEQENALLKKAAALFAKEVK